MSEPSFSIRVDHLLSGLTAAKTVLGNQTQFPTLSKVHIASDGDGVTIEATDRYRISRYIAPGPGDQLELLIPKGDVLEIIKLIKAVASKSLRSKVYAWVTADSIEFATVKYTLPASDPLDTYPSLSQIFSQPTKVEPEGPVTYDAEFLASMSNAAREVSGNRTSYVTLQLDGPGRSTRITTETPEGITWEGLLMPTRIPSA